jgi:hypothetical protein
VLLSCLIIAIGPFWLSSLCHSSIEEVVFSIVQPTMGSGNGGLLPCCGESFGPCGLISLKNRYMKMISSLGNPYSTVKLAEMPAPLSIIFFIIVLTHPMMCFLVQF